VDASIGTEGRVAYTPLVHAAGMVSVALLIPWSMAIQRWLYGVRGPSLHSVFSRFRFDVFGRALLLIGPAWGIALATVATDRSAGAGSAAVLIPSAVVVATALVVWLRTRRTGPARTPQLGRHVAGKPVGAAG
jgi:hypothetical protein